MINKGYVENLKEEICLQIDAKLTQTGSLDGRFMAHIVAQGYTQIPEVDFTKNYSPVFNNITLCVILLIW